MHYTACTCRRLHGNGLGAAGVAIWPLSQKQTQRDLASVESHVSVLAGFVWHGLTRPVDVCFLLGNNPRASERDLQYSTESPQKEPDKGDVEVSPESCEPDTVTDMLPLRGQAFPHISCMLTRQQLPGVNRLGAAKQTVTATSRLVI